MKHIFLVNSFSLRNKTNDMINRIKRVSDNLKLDYVIEVNDLNNSTEDIVNKYKKSEVIIFAIGGDGVINRVLNSIVDTKNILGFIPCGTGNDFYKSVRESFKYKIEETDIFKINERYFINVSCFGIDADIGNDTTVIRNKLIPKSLKYSISIINNFLNYTPRKFKIYVNDKIYKGEFSTIAVCNAGYYGGGYKINPNYNMNDGLLDVIVANKLSKLNLIKFVFKTKKGTHIKSKNVKYFKTDKITIKSENEISANVDGETLTNNVFKISKTNKKIKVYYNSKLINALKD